MKTTSIGLVGVTPMLSRSWGGMLCPEGENEQSCGWDLTEREEGDGEWVLSSKSLFLTHADDQSC